MNARPDRRFEPRAADAFEDSPEHDSETRQGRRPPSAKGFSKLGPRPLSPNPAEGLPAVFLRAWVRHPLIYRKRIKKVDGSAKPGDLVAVYCETQDEGEEARTVLLGYGLYNPRSEIAVRLVRYGEQIPDDLYWHDLLSRAVDLRRKTLRLDEVTDAYRIIHAEADGLPGLVVDRFADVLSAEVYSLGMFQRCRAIMDLLAPLCDATEYVVRTSPHILSQEGFDSPALRSAAAPLSVTVQEYGTRFRIHLDQESHKTGFFCDQRENRQRLASFCRGQTLLDLCCYTGAFAIQAKRLGGAADVTAVDLDEHPLRLARENAQLNHVRVKFVQADVFPYMRDMLRAQRQFDVVVLDPPKLIRSRAELDEGTRKHFDLNRLAMRLVRPGGLFLSCTCAGLLSQDEFVRLLYSAARSTGPTSDDPSSTPARAPLHVRVLAKTGAAADHPISGNCPETEYLKAVWMILDDPV